MAGSGDNNGRATSQQVYELVNAMRLELKQDISSMGTSLAANQGRLEKKFDDLEAGRLTRAEGAINDLKVKSATATTKLAIIGFISASVIGAVISAIVARIASQ